MRATGLPGLHANSRRGSRTGPVTPSSSGDIQIYLPAVRCCAPLNRKIESIDEVDMTGPSDAAILERAKSLSNEACFTVSLQHRRLRTTEPEDQVFVFRWWADLQFLIVALRR